MDALHGMAGLALNTIMDGGDGFATIKVLTAKK